MDKNVDQGFAVECTAAHPLLTKSPKEEEKSLCVFFRIGASISIGREIRCFPYAEFLVIVLLKPCNFCLLSQEAGVSLMPKES